MNEIEYFIFIPVKNFIAGAAKTTRCLAWLVLLTAVAEPIAMLKLGRAVTEIFGRTSDQLLHVVIILVSILAYWCHHVLLATRGAGLTRFLTLFCIIMSAILMVCSIYTLFTQELLLIRQHHTPVIITALLFVSCLINLPYMAAASLKLRLLIPTFLFFLLATATTTFLPPLCIIFKILTVCTGIPLLRRLQHIAPLIISMPPRN